MRGLVRRSAIFLANWLRTLLSSLSHSFLALGRNSRLKIGKIDRYPHFACSLAHDLGQFDVVEPVEDGFPRLGRNQVGGGAVALEDRHGRAFGGGDGGRRVLLEIADADPAGCEEGHVHDQIVGLFAARCNCPMTLQINTRLPQNESLLRLIFPRLQLEMQSRIALHVDDFEDFDAVVERPILNVMHSAAFAAQAGMDFIVKRIARCASCQTFD